MRAHAIVLLLAGALAGGCADIKLQVGLHTRSAVYANSLLEQEKGVMAILTANPPRVGTLQGVSPGAPLRGLGAWLRVNGEAVFGKRPWAIAQTTTTAGAPVRFTSRDGEVYAILLDLGESEFGIRGVDATGITGVRLLGVDESIEWRVTDGILHVRLPARVPVAPAHVLALGRGVRPAVTTR